GTPCCAVAPRLSEGSNALVLLLKKGRDLESLLSRVPGMSHKSLSGVSLQVALSDRFSEPAIPNAHGPRMSFRTSESAGGAPRINKMVMAQ
ncbi:hypothetical protein QBC46DRAFT_225666, partial [Diplogelasinospora grovesii]